MSALALLAVFCAPVATECLFVVFERQVASGRFDPFSPVFHALRRDKAREERLFRSLHDALDPSLKSSQSDLLYGISCLSRYEARCLDKARAIACNVGANRSSRIVAIGMLASIGNKDRQTIDVLYACLNESIPPETVRPRSSPHNVQLRCAAGIALWQLEKKTAAFEPHLLTFTESEWVRDREHALEIIVQIGEPLKRVLGPRVVAMTRDEDADIRAMAYSHLATFAESRSAAAKLLGRGLQDAAPALDRYWKAMEERARNGTLLDNGGALAWRGGFPDVGAMKYSLAALGDDAHAEIIAMLHHKSATVRDLGLNTARIMMHVEQRESAKKLLPEVEKLLKDPDPSTQAYAVAAVKEISGRK